MFVPALANNLVNIHFYGSQQNTIPRCNVRHAAKYVYACLAHTHTHSIFHNQILILSAFGNECIQT